VLSAHTDVVPVDGQDWTTEPFALTERDDLLIGRGVVDMNSSQPASRRPATGPARRRRGTSW